MTHRVDKVFKSLVLLPRISIFFIFHRFKKLSSVIFIQPYPLYFLLIKTKETAASTPGVLAFLTIYFKGFLFVLSRYAYPAFTKNTKYIISYQNIFIINKWEDSFLREWKVSCFDELKNNPIKISDIGI